MKMRTSSIVVAVVASFFVLAPAHAEYEGLSKFHWKRFIDKNEKQTAALIAADLAQVAAEQQVAEALASARLAHFQDRLAAIDPIDWKAHEERVQLSAVTVTVTSGEVQARRAPPEGERDALRILAAKIADRETTGSTRKIEVPGLKQERTATTRSATSPAHEPWWTAPIFAFLAKLGW